MPLTAAADSENAASELLLDIQTEPSQPKVLPVRCRAVASFVAT
jgi:hypothetical protein